MTWPKYVVLAWLVLSALSLIVGIGKPRTPLTPNDVAALLVVLAGLAWLVVIA